MERLDDLEAFLAIVEKGSQAGAARYLKRSLQSLNRSLVTLERGLGVDLIKRTSRRSEPTDAGLLFYERIKPAVLDIMEARHEAAKARGDVAGLLRVGAPVLFATRYVAPAVCGFLKLYPGVEIELRSSDEQIDLFAEGIDIAVRIGDAADDTLIARRLSALRVVTCAAPSYLSEHGRPEHPRDLERHDCILRAGADIVRDWRFRTDDRPHTARVNGRLRANSAAVIRLAASRGLGVAQLPLWQIGDLVDAGVLEIVLPEFEAEGMPIQLVWTPSRAPLERTRRFVDYLTSSLKTELF